MQYTMCNIKYLSLQGRPLRVSPQQPANSTPVPPPPKPKSASTEAAKQENEEILNAILPPRYSSSHLKCIWFNRFKPRSHSSQLLPLQGMDGGEPTVGAASVQCALYKNRCYSPGGTAGHKAAAKAGQRNRNLPCPQGALFPVLW